MTHVVRAAAATSRASRRCARDRSLAAVGLECQLGPPPPSPPPPLRLFDLVTAPLADFLQQKCRQRCRDSGGALKVEYLHPLGRNHPEHEQ